MTAPRISLNQQIDGIVEAIRRQYPASLKASAELYQRQRLEAAEKTLRAIAAREDDVRALLASARDGGGA